MDGLPEPLRQGLFASARSYPIIVRLAQREPRSIDELSDAPSRSTASDQLSETQP